MSAASRLSRFMLYAEERQVDFFAKVSDLTGHPGKVQESPVIEIDNVPWRIMVSATSELLTVSIACKIESPSCVYAAASLNSAPGGQIAERFDSEHCSTVLATFPIPTIRRSQHPVRSMRLQVSIRAEAPTSLKAFDNSESEDQLSDIIFEVEGHQLHVHRVILACMSPVFRSMFYGHFVEAEGSSEQQQTNKVIPFPDKDLSLMLEMLSTIYPPQLEVHAIRAKFMLPLYMEYQICHMITKCERVLCESDIYRQSSKDENGNGKAEPIGKSAAVLDEAMDHLFLCSLYKLDRLQQLAVAVVAHRRSEDFDQHVNFPKLSTEIKLDLYRGRVYRLEKRSEGRPEHVVERPERTITPDRDSGDRPITP